MLRPPTYSRCPEGTPPPPSSVYGSPNTKVLLVLSMTSTSDLNPVASLKKTGISSSRVSDFYEPYVCSVDTGAIPVHRERRNFGKRASRIARHFVGSSVISGG